MPPTKQPEKPTLRAVETTPAPTAAKVHPLFPALRTYPSQVRVYALERDGSTELLETMSAADLDPGAEPLGVSQMLARASLRVAFGPGVYRVQALSEGGGVLGGPQRIVIGQTEDEQRPHQHTPRAPIAAGPTALQQSVDASIATGTAKAYLDELRTSAARAADSANNQVTALAAMMQSTQQAQTAMFQTVLTNLSAQSNRGNDPVLLEILRERGSHNQALLDSNQKLRDELSEMRRQHAVAEMKNVDPVTKKVLEMADMFTIGMAAKHDAAAAAEGPRPQLPPPAPAKPPTLLETITSHAAIDAAAVDLPALAASLDRAVTGTMQGDDARNVLTAGVLARDGALPDELHGRLTQVLIKFGGARVRTAQ
jgi:DNA-binding TFAR19-related protein (PDSD5 family)